MEHNFAEGTVLKTTFDEDTSLETVTVGSREMGLDGQIDVTDSDGIATYIFPNEIVSVVSTPGARITNIESGGEPALTKGFFDGAAKPEFVIQGVKDLTGLTVSAPDATEPLASLVFLDDPGADPEIARAVFNSALIWLAARYERRISFSYKKATADITAYHVLVPEGVNDGLFGGIDEQRDGAYRQFRIDRIQGHVIV